MLDSIFNNESEGQYLNANFKAQLYLNAVIFCLKN